MATQQKNVDGTTSFKTLLGLLSLALIPKPTKKIELSGVPVRIDTTKEIYFNDVYINTSLPESEDHMSIVVYFIQPRIEVVNSDMDMTLTFTQDHFFMKMGDTIKINKPFDSVTMQCSSSAIKQENIGYRKTVKIAGRQDDFVLLNISFSNPSKAKALASTTTTTTTTDSKKRKVTDTKPRNEKPKQRK